ncbi:hypothetical protein SAMN05216262_10976 [Colwellia chukchiensis]|uniref:GAF domain-containing protein n=1 Tax=Colwellia chukchiensis TaxID=641665 RepID=A0A1H7PD65_9GAMM|nr:GAF domain-containing protein [Colwellia chukchiensis]SEL33586.1 hypothetical protein SAMN05216262_10976 [Colwellia chukchiensis]
MMNLAINEAALATALKQGNTKAYFIALQEELSRHFTIKLLTFSEVDMTALKAKRLYSSNEGSYSIGGLKPIEQNAWTARVIEQQQVFVAHQHSELAKVFFDHALIAELGLGSVINWPVVMHSKVIGTVNMLAEDGAYLHSDLQPLEQLLPWLAIAFLSNSTCKE